VCDNTAFFILKL